MGGEGSPSGADFPSRPARARRTTGPFRFLQAPLFQLRTEPSVMLSFGERNPVRHQLDVGVFAHPIREAYLVANHWKNGSLDR
jgi:hypothetical protein